MKYLLLCILLLATFISCKKENTISEAEKSAIEYNGDKNIVGEYKGNMEWSRINYNGVLINSEKNIKKTISVKYTGENFVEVSYDYPSDFKYKVYEFKLLSKVVDNSDSHIEYVFTGKPKNYPDGLTYAAQLIIKSYLEKRELTFSGISYVESDDGNKILSVERIDFNNYYL